MYLVQILLPRADNTGTPFSQNDFDRVKEELASRFDGVTAYLRAPAEGLWHEGTARESDDIVIFEVMVAEVNIADWGQRRSDLERRFRQDTVVIRYMPMTLI